MTDDVRVAREALQAIDNELGWSTSIRWVEEKVQAALVALEAAEAAQAERDAKIRAHAEATLEHALDWGHDSFAQDAEAILGLLAAKTTTEPEQT